MKYTIYKPNKNVNGCAGSFQISQVGPKLTSNLFVSMIQQSGWDDQKKTGSFKGSRDDESKNINFKLNVSEAGEILSSMKTRIPFVAFHTFSDDSTIIKFTPWDQKRKVLGKDGEEWHTVPSWGLTVTRNKTNVFKLPLTAGESEVLAKLLDQFIEDALLEAAQEQSTKQAQGSSTSVKQLSSEPKEDESSDEEDDDIPF